MRHVGYRVFSNVGSCAVAFSVVLLFTLSAHAYFWLNLLSFLLLSCGFSCAIHDHGLGKKNIFDVLQFDGYSEVPRAHRNTFGRQYGVFQKELLKNFFAFIATVTTSVFLSAVKLPL